jgi:pimeloyl-ACP methyl ester carboxylesterase
MMRRVPVIDKHAASFLYRGRKVTFNFYARQQADAVIHTILFLGTGQVGKIPRWVAANMPAGVVVVEGLPHWESDPSGSDLVAFSHLYTQSAFDAVLEKFKGSAIHVIGSSQAAPSAIWLANTNSAQIKNVALVLPMGLNTAYFGSDDMTRFRELRRRALLTLVQRDQLLFSDIRNVYISLSLLRIILAGINDGSTVRKYTIGISEDMTEAMRRLAATQKRLHRKLLVYVGEHDKVFPSSEVRQTLKEAGIHDVVVTTAPGISHGSLAVRTYNAFLAGVVKDIYS